MSGALVAALLAMALPEGSARYRFELSGEHVGLVELVIRCLGETCAAVWTSERRAPAEAGGRRSSRRVEVEVDRRGRWRGGRLRVLEDGDARRGAGVPGAVPEVLAEVVLGREVVPAARTGWRSALAPGETCVDTFQEEGGTRGRACARAVGDGLAAVVSGVAEAITPSRDGFPAAVSIPAQAARFVRDPAATAPRRPPRLHGILVAGTADPARAARFCGVARDPDPPAAELGFLPPPRALGPSCREKTAAWLARAARAGIRGRTAVGVAWDGARFVWHAWAEVRLERGWVPVDPAFEQLPALGPRFTLATFESGDETARERAGRRILACWGRARVRGD